MSIAALRQHRPLSQPSSLRNQLLVTMRGPSRGRNARARQPPAKKKQSWKHKFMCLAFCGQSQAPASEIDRKELFEAGLGEKEIEFDNLDCSPSEFRETIFATFQLCEAGGYQFYVFLTAGILRSFHPLF